MYGAKSVRTHHGRFDGQSADRDAQKTGESYCRFVQVINGREIGAFERNVDAANGQMPRR